MLLLSTQRSSLPDFQPNYIEVIRLSSKELCRLLLCGHNDLSVIVNRGITEETMKFIRSTSCFEKRWYFTLRFSFATVAAWLSSTRGGGQRGCPLDAIWSKNNWKISTTIEICITIDFAPSLKKFLRESQKLLLALALAPSQFLVLFTFAVDVRKYC